LLEIGEYLIVRDQGVAPRSGGREVEVRSVEEHAGMLNAISSHATVLHKAFPSIRDEQAMDIIIMT
jgi:hypothetical protein